MTAIRADSGEFREFERSGWESVAAEYDNAFGTLTAQVIEPLLDAVGAGRGVRLLDVATGPGYLAAAAARRGAEVVGVDFSLTMVAAARKRYPEVEFREGNAEALPFADGAFDVVVMNFGMLHFERPDQALTEAHRVLRPGGRVGFTVWAKPDETVGFAIVLRATETHGNMQVPLPKGPPFFRFSDPEESSRTLREHGFVNPMIVKVPQLWRLPSPDALFEAMLEATVRTAGLLRGQTREALSLIRAAMREAAAAYQNDGGIEFPMPAVLSTAMKPRADHAP